MVRRGRIGLLAAIGLVAASGASGQQSVAIEGVTIIDVKAGVPLPGRTVLIEQGRIRAVGPAGKVPLPRGTERIAGAGRFLIPGLWDAHVHLQAGGRATLARFTQFGVTSVRDLGGAFDSVRGWRAAIQSGTLMGPRILQAGPVVENGAWLAKVRELDLPGIREVLAERIGVMTVADAERAADSVARLGAKLLKVRNSPPPAAYRALLAAARRHGLLIAGHQPAGDIGLDGAAEAGQRSLEHVEQLGVLDSLSPARRKRTLELLASRPVWITPTLVTSFGRFRPDSLVTAIVDGTADDPNGALVTPQLRMAWREMQALKKYDSPIDFYRRSVDGGLVAMRELHRAGVPILAGTDFGVPLAYPGLSLHAELALLVDSLHLKPIEAIRAATLEPARYARMTDSLGTIAPGQVADLVLLDADPLAVITNTERIAAVFVRGRRIR